MPKWTGNYLLQFVISRTRQEAGPNVRAWDRTGKLVLETRVWFPDAWQVAIFDIAGAADGEVAVAGAAYTNSGVRAPFIAWISPVRYDAAGRADVALLSRGALFWPRRLRVGFGRTLR
jgi:hypothetical protein